MKRLLIRGNYLKGGKEGRTLRLARTAAAEPKRPRREPNHTHELTRGATTGARRGQEKVAGCRRGSSPFLGVLSPPQPSTSHLCSPLLRTLPKMLPSPQTTCQGAPRPSGHSSSKKKKSKYFKEPHRPQLSLRGSQSFHVHAKTSGSAYLLNAGL